MSLNQGEFDDETCTEISGCALCLGLAGQAFATDLKHWPADQAKALDAMIAANANKGNYAVFDMDNTSYRYDLEESLLPFMENKGLITRDKLDPSLKLIPFKDTAEHKESLFSYYYRLCEIDDMVCYPWVAQVFSGFTLKELKGYVDELMASGKPVPSTYYEGDVVKTIDVNPPKIFTGQTRALQQADGERHRGLRDDRRLRRTGAHGRGRSEVRLQREAAERDRREPAAQGPPRPAS